MHLDGNVFCSLGSIETIACGVARCALAVFRPATAASLVRPASEGSSLAKDQ
jgi:hypothetical protein